MIEIVKYIPLVGKPLEVVEQAVRADGKYVRVVIKDDVYQMVTSDYNLSRLNVVVKNGIVTAIQGLG